MATWPKVAPATTLNDETYAPINLGMVGAAKIVIKCRTASAMLISDDPQGTNYFTLASGAQLELDVMGGNVGGILSSIELQTNGTFTGNADGWTLPAGFTYNANAVDKDGDGTGALSQAIAITAGQIYQVVYVISNWTVGTVTPKVGGKSGTAKGANGTYTEYIKATNATDGLEFAPTNTARFTIDSITMKLFTFRNELYAKSPSGAIVLECIYY